MTQPTSERVSSMMQRLFLALAAGCLALGIYARVELFVRNGPFGVIDDLVGTAAVWHEYVGDELSTVPSNRVGEFGLSAVLYAIARLFALDSAHSMSLLAFVCSLGLLVAGPLFMLSIGAGRWEAMAFMGVLALAPQAIQETLIANSNGPFLLFAALGTAGVIDFWRRGRWVCLAMGGAALAFAMTIRGTTLLHMGPLVVTLAVAHGLLPRESRPSWRRLACVVAALAGAVLLVSAVKTHVNGRIVAHYTQRDGVAPAPHPYFTYVLYDGIMTGPYLSDPAGWNWRQRVRKDPALRHLDPIQRGDSALKIIGDHRSRYVHNYFLGVWMTLTKAFAERRLNLVGWVPMVLGAVCLLARRRWFTGLVLAGWISVYMFVQPLIAVGNRTIWPISFGLAAMGALFLGWLIQSCLDRSRAGGPLRWFALMVIGVLVGCFAVGTIACARTPVADYRNEARGHIADAPGRRTRILSPSVTICAYGRRMDYIQMMPTDNTDAQTSHILSAAPDYVFFPVMYDTGWGGAYTAVHDALKKDVRRPWRLVWSNGEAELWGSGGNTD